MLQVEFDEKDPRDPVHYSYPLKWTITIVGCFFSILAGNGTLQQFNALAEDMYAKVRPRRHIPWGFLQWSEIWIAQHFKLLSA